MKNRRGFLFMAAGIVLLTAAIGLTVFNLVTENHAGRSSAEVVRKLRELIPEDTEDAASSGEGSDADRSVSNEASAPEAQSAPYLLHPEMAMPVYNVDGNDYIGILEIPDLGLTLPVMSEWSYPGLRIAPCRYVGTVYMKNMVIAAHNYDTHFGRLKELSQGAEVKFTDADGNEFYYEVVQSEILAPTAIEEMTDGGWDLSLFTCTYGGKTRFTVRCRMVSSMYHA
jgi:sortase A